MAEEFKAGCKRPEIKKKIDEASSVENVVVKKEGASMIKVGQAAPDFSAAGFFQGKFMNFDLSEFLGKWVLLCFYPGDFTFV